MLGPMPDAWCLCISSSCRRPRKQAAFEGGKAGKSLLLSSQCHVCGGSETDGKMRKQEVRTKNSATDKPEMNVVGRKSKQ